MTTLLSPAYEPLAAQAPMPHRKLIRSWLAPICERSTAYALWLVAVDLLLFAAGLVLTVTAGHPAVPCSTSSMAARGDGGSCGHHQVTPGWRCAARCATMRALVDCGDERKPCR